MGDNWSPLNSSAQADNLIDRASNENGMVFSYFGSSYISNMFVILATISLWFIHADSIVVLQLCSSIVALL